MPAACKPLGGMVEDGQHVEAEGPKQHVVRAAGMVLTAADADHRPRLGDDLQRPGDLHAAPRRHVDQRDVVLVDRGTVGNRPVGQDVAIPVLAGVPDDDLQQTLEAMGQAESCDSKAEPPVFEPDIAVRGRSVKLRRSCQRRSLHGRPPAPDDQDPAPDDQDARF